MQILDFDEARHSLNIAISVSKLTQVTALREFVKSWNGSGVCTNCSMYYAEFPCLNTHEMMRIISGWNAQLPNDLKLLQL